ncbi:MAG: hypothetical protein ACRDIY_16210 [Chloroflexota bacterium]
MDDQTLIDAFIDPDTDRYPGGQADARLRLSGISVWALIGYLRVVDGNVERAAQDYAVPLEAVQAALAYYRRHRSLIDARLLLNSA